MTEAGPGESDHSLLAGIVAGDRGSLARAITLVESDRQQDVASSQQLLAAIADRCGRSVRIGISGVPGVGKSSFIDTFGSLLTARGQRVAVLAVDPSSSISGGSILGDKTRMERLGVDRRAFIRPSPGGSSVGGVARRTREALLLCEAAGFDVVIVETIGVGQSEVAVAHMVDSFVLLMLAGAGDELQGIKRGIMELADVIAVNKADGDNRSAALGAATEISSVLPLMPRRHAEWKPPVLSCSARTGDGVAAVFTAIEAHRECLGADGIAQRRQEQALLWFDETLKDMLLREFLGRDSIATALPELRRQVGEGALQPTAAVLSLLGRD